MHLVKKQLFMDNFGLKKQSCMTQRMKSCRNMRVKPHFAQKTKNEIYRYMSEEVYSTVQTDLVLDAAYLINDSAHLFSFLFTVLRKHNGRVVTPEDWAVRRSDS